MVPKLGTPTSRTDFTIDLWLVTKLLAIHEFYGYNLQRWWFWGRIWAFYLKSKSFVCILSTDIVNEGGITSDGSDPYWVKLETTS